MRALLLFSAFFISVALFAQSPITKSYGANSILKSHASYTILADSRGYIWAGTASDGVVRYDGKGENGFKRYTTKDGLAGNVIMSIYEDHDGRIWLAAQANGISVFDGKNFTNYRSEDSLGLTTNNPTTFFRTSKGEMLIGQYGGNLLRFKDGKFKEVDSTLPNMIIWKILEDQNGVVWIATGESGLGRYENGKISFVNEKLGLPISWTMGLEIDDNGDLLCGSAKGLYRIRDSKIVTKYGKENGFPSDVTANEIRSLYKAKNGSIYLGSYQRLWKLEGDTVYNIPRNGELTSLPTDFTEDQNGNIWIATEKNGIVQLFDNGIEQVSLPDGDNKLLNFTIDNEQKVWISSPKALYTISEKGRAKQLGEDYFLQLPEVNGIFVLNEENIIIVTEEYGTAQAEKKDNYYLHQVSKRGIFRAIMDDSVYYATSSPGFFTIDSKTFETLDFVTDINEKRDFGIMYSFERGEDGTNWIGTYDKATIIHFKENDTIVYDKENGLACNSPIMDLTFDRGGTLWYLTLDGTIGYLDKDHFTQINSPKKFPASFLIFDQNDNLWIANDGGIAMLELDGKKIISTRQFSKSDGIEELPTNQLKMLDDGRLLLGKYGQHLYFINPDKIQPNKEIPRVYITDIYGKDNGILDSTWYSLDSNFYRIPANLNLPYDENNLTIHLNSVYFSAPDSIKYSYQLIGSDEEWSVPQTSPTIIFTNLSAGDYQLNIKAISINQIESEIISFKFKVKTPWFQSWWFYTLIILMLGGVIYLFIQFRLSKLQKDKERLENVVEERTREVVLEKEKVQEQHKEILDSINYAKRIQAAILPPKKLIKEYIKNSFVLYKPKDVVAGDFYWMEPYANGVYFAAADCTGHGVPGAMVSVVCNNALNRSVREFGLTDPGQILDKTREIVIQEFEKSEEEVKDGMDIAICKLEDNKLVFAGAHNPLWIIRSGAEEVEEIKADKQPIGKFEAAKPFQSKEIELNPGDTFYLFSDGFADQFGGDKGKKFKSANFKKLLISIQHHPIEEHIKLIDDSFEEWKGSLEQLDDLCVIGVRL